MADMHDHDGGLSHDLPRLLSRRRALGLVGGAAGFALLAACGEDETGAVAAPAEQTSTVPPDGETVPEGEIPAETAGPYPGDGSNGPNVLTQSGVVRKDIRSGFGGASGSAEGIPLTVRLTITDHGSGGKALEGAAVYLWHCDRDGGYSLYSSGLTEQNYLRGVQVADSDGVLEFRTIFPGAYSGRWPHIHFEVYADLDTATKAGTKLRTTQLALPEAICKEVYATTGYSRSVTNLANSSLQSDNVFSDGWTLQLAKVTGSVDTGYVASLGVPV